MYVNKVTCHFLSGNYAYSSYGENPFSPKAHIGASNADVLVDMRKKKKSLVGVGLKENSQDSQDHHLD